MRLVYSLVMPRLDYGNISIYGISEGLLNKLQKAQNAAARLVVSVDAVTILLLISVIIYTGRGYRSDP